MLILRKQDATLKRCFGKDGKIVDYDWNYLSELRTLKEPHVGMPRFLDLLEYLASPGLEHIWLLLDIKVRLYPPANPRSLTTKHKRSTTISTTSCG